MDDKHRTLMSSKYYKAYDSLFKKLPLIRKYFVIDDDEVVDKGRINDG